VTDTPTLKNRRAHDALARIRAQATMRVPISCPSTRSHAPKHVLDTYTRPGPVRESRRLRPGPRVKLNRGRQARVPQPYPRRSSSALMTKSLWPVTFPSFNESLFRGPSTGRDGPTALGPGSGCRDQAALYHCDQKCTFRESNRGRGGPEGIFEAFFSMKHPVH
jgi:hypothetical protein